MLRRGDRTFVLVDTAGLRRKRRQRQGIEYYSELRALQAAERADVALVLVDSSEGVVEQDLAVADVARKSMSSTLVVLSKWDIAEVGIEDVRDRGLRRASGSDRRSSPFRRRRSAVSDGARPGRGALRQVHLARPDRRAEPLPERAAAGPPAPSRNGKSLNLLYGTQTTVRPPRFRFFVNDPGLITRDYGYWVENQLRDRFELEGVPVSIDFVRRA